MTCSDQEKEQILNKWNEIKVLIESLELDITKNAHGNKSAGVRSRKGLRLLKDLSSKLIKTTIQAEKK